MYVYIVPPNRSYVCVLGSMFFLSSLVMNMVRCLCARDTEEMNYTIKDTQSNAIQYSTNVDILSLYLFKDFAEVFTNFHNVTVQICDFLKRCNLT